MRAAPLLGPDQPYQSMSRGLGRVERQAHHWAVVFPHGGAPERLPARFSSRDVALRALDLVRVWRAAREGGKGLSSLALSGSLEVRPYLA